METSYAYFFTATIKFWHKLLEPDKYKQIILDSLQFLVEKQRIKLYAFVIMPNHIHIIWQMCNNNEKRNVQRDFLKYTAQQIKFDLIVNHPKVLSYFKVNQKNRDYQFWQNRPLSIDLYNEKVFEQKLDYIHNNPIQEKWKLCSKPEDYFYSSAAFYYTGSNRFPFVSHYKD
jgi:REP element-mobilizing transposase RayT